MCHTSSVWHSTVYVLRGWGKVSSENATIIMKPKPTVTKSSDLSRPQDVLSVPQQSTNMSVTSPSENTPEVQKPIMVGGNGNSGRTFPSPVVDSRGVVVIQGMDISPETSGAADLVPAF